MQTVQNAVTQVTRLTRLTGYCWQMVLPILAHLKVHYNILLHLFVTAKDTFTFIYVFILIQKVKGHTCLKTPSSTWAVGWNGCCHVSVLNSWTLPFCDQIKEEFKSSNFIFELLNFRPIWIYNFWTFELFLYLNV